MTNRILQNVFHNKILLSDLYRIASNNVLMSKFNRNISITSFKRFSEKASNDSSKIPVHYITKTGEKITVYGQDGDNLMHLAQRNNIEIEGACEASLACCTCHVYVNEKFYDQLPPPEEEEEDLLDMAPFLKSNSRLSCQIILNKDIADIEVTLPQATRNFYVDGSKPASH